MKHNLNYWLDMAKIKRKVWNDDDMVSAMNAVLVEKMKCGTAAKKYNVPRKSLENRVKGRVTHGVKPGPTTILSSEDEGALVEYIKFMCSRGFPMTKKICKAYAWAIAKCHAGSHTSFKSEKWCHPKFALRKADTLDCGRARMANQSVVREYFSLLEKTLDTLKIKDIPECIYNCDESGMCLDAKKEKVIVPVGTKHVYS